ncbi:hypothetical protein Q3A90_10965 [Priestia megaterium]|uniref:hypothetical protein n=1 Tax=Priestia megaterium TaxID=1404 RepID=UPI0026749222|nr:hypothetical protein [Priestia megaterium]WKU25347.1 hypothetical protein Q3A90_10965 [Priestia megaterium]
MKLELKDLTLPVFYYYLQTYWPVLPVSHVDIPTVWLFVALFVIGIYRRHREEKLKQEIKNEILKDLRM